MLKYLLFDLDGTLVDTSEGILESAQYALEKCGLKENSVEKLKCFIGPPLKSAFVSLYEMSNKRADEATKVFREHYKDKGKNLCSLYEGVSDVLENLKQEGYSLFVATSKPTIFAVDILKNLNINQYFTDIIGSNMDGTRSRKSEIINFILQKYKIADKDEVVMIGDKSQDVVGAKETGIHSIGVLYGFGSREELQSENPDIILNEVQEILEYLRCAK